MQKQTGDDLYKWKYAHAPAHAHSYTQMKISKYNRRTESKSNRKKCLVRRAPSLMPDVPVWHLSRRELKAASGSLAPHLPLSSCRQTSSRRQGPVRSLLWNVLLKRRIGPTSSFRPRSVPQDQPEILGFWRWRIGEWAACSLPSVPLRTRGSGSGAGTLRGRARVSLAAAKHKQTRKTLW